MNKHSKQMEKDLIDLTKVNGVSGHEEEVANLIKEKFSTLKDVEFDRDNLGSIMAKIKGKGGENAPLIAMDAHIDEVGFMVIDIDDKGFIKFGPIGGWWGHVVLGQLIDIIKRDGKVLTGIVGSTPPHVLEPKQRKDVVNIDKMFIDVGAKNKDDVKDLGIHIGDIIVPHSDTWMMENGDYMVGKALDDRAGVAIALEVMRRLQEEEHESDVMFVGSTQEEVGLRGAKTAFHKWTPDIAFAVDVTISNDQPGMEPKPAKIGSGVSFSLYDMDAISNPKLRRMIEEVAIKNNIPYTHDAFIRGGTDAGTIHLTKEGVITIVLSLPSRYIHSHNSLVSMHDLQVTVDLLVEFIKEFNNDKLKELQY